MSIIHRPVIVGVDGSPAAFGAVRWAADIAVRMGRPLRIMHALGVPGPYEEITDEHGLALDAATEARHWFPGLHVTTSTWYGEPVRVLREQSRHAELVVVGSRGHGGFHALLVGSVGVHLAGYSHCPVLVVHHAERWAGPEAVLPSDRPVVAGADGSPGGQQALELAFREASARKVPLVAVRAWQEPASRLARRVNPDRLAADLAADLGQLQAKDPAVRLEPRVVHGPPVQVLLDAARDALMVVLGARGHGGFAGLRIGGVTQHVLEHAETPVLVARFA
ncbi:universal stress protein [Dactylosporangium aurantiacum]|uniref:Universal stress protein n=1 Tax=Dactylosporangium aurantiacum TaxID=35754 RepID=A0A9Q9MII2_9ACTN|nr:universal stress protein [Dactylosporangium aurantiacum]MDG6105871.1 universal stress protein [Dactylosporangium aurantiacum]UWZ57954.1 universal stress protein [Dactylosporangium aurantiacum]